MSKEAEVKMSPPWIEFYRKMCAMFDSDPEIHMDYNDDERTITMRVDNAVKADALSQIVPPSKVFGTVKVKINIVPANGKVSVSQLYKTAFMGNPVFNNAYTIEGIYDNPLTYVVFNRMIVQFFNDNLGDIHGNITTLHQTIATDIFEDVQGIFYCTDTGNDKIGKPLGEWP